jgi:hypothetical protein
MRAIRRHRRSVVARSGRRYAVCGLRVPPCRSATSRLVVTFATWIPFSTLVLLIIMSAYAIESPLPQQHGPSRIAAYSIDDYATAFRR